jgi:hypothetical protein
MSKKISLSLALAGLILLGVACTTNTNNNLNTNTNQPVVGANEVILFYGTGCPHCVKVDEFLTANNIAAKVKFSKLEVFYNQDNAKLLGEKATACGLDTQSIGVPFLYDPNNNPKCLTGDVDVTNYFKQKSGL